MDGLLYNIHYEIAAAVFLVVLLVYLRIQYTAKERSSKKFRHLVLMVIVCDLTDVATGIIISYAASLSWAVCQISNTIYYGVLLYMLYLYIDYIEVFTRHRINKVNKIINQSLLIGASVILIININTGWVFNFSATGEYLHGPLYYMLYALSMYFLVDSLVVSIINRSWMTKRQFASVIFFAVMLLIGTALQVIWFPHVLLNLFFASVAVLIITFALETPDYFKLNLAMEQLKKTAEELDIAMKDAEDARNEAIEANKAKSDFLASMSHEIRTPINGVLGMNSMILKEAKDSSIIEYARNIDSAGNGLLSLINDILDFSKIESGKMEIIPVEYKLSNVLSDAYNMVFMRAQGKGLDLVFENNPTIPNMLYGDEARVRQIIVNLLTNGIKYTEEGMVLLTADWRQGEMADEMELIVSVKDTGIGIKKKNLARLFEAFSRVDQARNRNIEGTGLGLKITKQFLDMMKGTIEVESEYGAGSEFTVTIPQRILGKETLDDFAKYSNISTDDEKVIYNKFTCPDGHVLVVDDVEMNLKVFKGLLKETKLNIDTATSGDECISLIQNNTYDVIFLDHRMPHKDGIETLHEMKTMTSVFNPNIPVIMLTANAIQGVRDEYINEGFTDYLTKPVREEDLNAMLIKYLPDELLHFGEDEAVDETAAMMEKAFDIKDSQETVDGMNPVFAKRFSFLDTKAGMAFCMGSEEFYESIIQEFRSSNKYDEVQECYDDADLSNYTIHVHGIKSSAQTIGALELSELAKGLEMAANSEDIDYLKGNHYVFMRKYGELLDALDEVYGGY